MRSAFTLIIDFDHTLFDTSAFLDAARKLAKQHGILKSDFYRTFTEITDGNSDAPYTLTGHLEALARWRQIEGSLLSDQLGELVAHSRHFLYPDSFSFLKKVRKWDVSTHLVTFADTDLRKCQIEATGIAKLVDHIHIIATSRDDKVAAIKALTASTRRAVVVDDHPKILKALEDTPILAVRVRRRVLSRYRGLEPRLTGVPIFRTLSDVYIFLQPLLCTLGRRVPSTAGLRS
jgi:FMN phosphatase YigB (HAD superfamily)